MGSKFSLPEEPIICVIGLGYVGLPLAIEFSKKYKVVGYDSNSSRTESLRSGIDWSGEVDLTGSINSTSLIFTSSVTEISVANVYIVAVPTPIDADKAPDMSCLELACRTVAPILCVGDGVIFESTVYPGATEEFCVPLLEKYSGRCLHDDFYVGYSPERINPGDKERTIRDIIKVTSGSCDSSSAFINALYGSIIEAGTYQAPSIRVAEAAKVIENIQRDVNIALFNEFAMLFDKLNVPSAEVFDAAATKWNFIRFAPGLVGGHCIGVDPYYLTHKAVSEGFDPQMILAGRSVNESIPSFIAERIEKDLSARGCEMREARALIMGATFKENCRDIRNSKSFALYFELSNLGVEVEMIDELADRAEVLRSYSVELKELKEASHYDVVIVAVGHDYISDLGIQKIRSFGGKEMLVYDLKGIFPSTYVNFQL